MGQYEAVYRSSGEGLSANVVQALQERQQFIRCDIRWSYGCAATNKHSRRLRRASALNKEGSASTAPAVSMQVVSADIFDEPVSRDDLKPIKIVDQPFILPSLVVKSCDERARTHADPLIGELWEHVQHVWQRSACITSQL